MINPRQINNINTTPMEKLKFRNFKNLKSGRDQFSNMSYETLQQKCTSETVERLTIDLAGDVDSIARAMRWILRGLLPDRAIRKVKTDLEIQFNARGAQ